LFEIVSGDKIYFYIRAGLSLREGSGDVIGRKESYHMHDEAFISFTDLPLSQ